MYGPAWAAIPSLVRRNLVWSRGESNPGGDIAESSRCASTSGPTLSSLILLLVLGAVRIGFPKKHRLVAGPRPPFGPPTKASPSFQLLAVRQPGRDDIGDVLVRQGQSSGLHGAHDIAGLSGAVV